MTDHRHSPSSQSAVAFHSVAAARNVGLLRLRRYGVPIIFLTGYGDIAMTVRAVKAGAVDVLTKPVDDEALLNDVRQCLTSCDEGRVYLEAIRERRCIASGSSSPIRILIVDDHPLVREGIGGLVGVQPDMTVVGEAATGSDAIQQFRAYRPDVTLMDIQIPEINGLDALIAIRTEFPDARVIVLTTYEGDVHIRRALKAGALYRPRSRSRSPCM